MPDHRGIGIPETIFVDTFNALLGGTAIGKLHLDYAALDEIVYEAAKATCRHYGVGPYQRPAAVEGCPAVNPGGDQAPPPEPERA